MSGNGHKTVIVDDVNTITTTVERHRVIVELSRKDIGILVAALSLLTGDRRFAHQQDSATALLWKLVDEVSGPTKRVDRRVSGAEWESATEETT